MRNQIDISLARFLMILSLVLLAVLEYMWIHNEYNNAFRGMEENLSHVMFSSMRDVEDSLIFSKLAEHPMLGQSPDSLNKDLMIVINTEDSVREVSKSGFEGKSKRESFEYTHRRKVRGMLLRQLAMDTTIFDTPNIDLSTIVMKHINLSDSAGAYSGYKMISWEGGDTALAAAMSRPQFDLLADRKIALINPHYRADIFHSLLPHLSFAVFLWMMVGAAFYYIWKNLRQQIQLNALRDEFVSNITHELKTPITTVGVALESLNMSAELQNTQSRKYLDICQSELHRLSSLVERILNNRAPQVNFEKIDLRQTLDDVMDRMKVQFDKRLAQVSIQQEGSDFRMLGDKEHMSGVFYNLLDNALKYSQGAPVIHIKLTNQDGSVRLDVRDEGIGVPADFQHKIFEKLYRVPQGNRHDVKGHGLGLSYVADVVRQHKGTITMVSEPGKGSVFTLTFPCWPDATGRAESVDVKPADEFILSPNTSL